LPGYQKWFAERGRWFSPEFREVVEAEIRRGLPERASFYSTGQEGSPATEA
jgi:hypothetical protein